MLLTSLDTTRQHWNADLIYDVGMHEAQDTAYYLARGYRVIAVDADIRQIERARGSFSNAIAGNRLTLLPYAIGNDDGMTDFFLSENTVWNSTNREIAGRERLAVESIRAPMRRLATLFRDYGVPLYCKIDIEGMDAVCLQTLDEAADLPPYISVETECAGDARTLTEADALYTLSQLQRLGYRRFKLVDQRSLVVLGRDSVYKSRPHLMEAVKRRLGVGRYRYYDFSAAVAERHAQLERSHGYAFGEGASGPFGSDLDGAWLDPQTAEQTLLRHRRDYFRMRDAKPYGFWCDWHASLFSNDVATKQ